MNMDDDEIEEGEISCGDSYEGNLEDPNNVSAEKDRGVTTLPKVPEYTENNDLQVWRSSAQETHLSMERRQRVWARGKDGQYDRECDIQFVAAQHPSPHSRLDETHRRISPIYDGVVQRRCDSNSMSPNTGVRVSRRSRRSQNTNHRGKTRQGPNRGVFSANKETRSCSPSPRKRCQENSSPSPSSSFSPSGSGHERKRVANHRTMRRRRKQASISTSSLSSSDSQGVRRIRTQRRRRRSSSQSASSQESSPSPTVKKRWNKSSSISSESSPSSGLPVGRTSKPGVNQRSSIPGQRKHFRNYNRSECSDDDSDDEAIDHRALKKTRHNYNDSSSSDSSQRERRRDEDFSRKPAVNCTLDTAPQQSGLTDKSDHPSEANHEDKAETDGYVSSNFRNAQFQSEKHVCRQQEGANELNSVCKAGDPKPRDAVKGSIEAAGEWQESGGEVKVQGDTQGTRLLEEPERNTLQSQQTGDFLETVQDEWDLLEVEEDTDHLEEGGDFLESVEEEWDLLEAKEVGEERGEGCEGGSKGAVSVSRTLLQERRQRAQHLLGSRHTAPGSQHLITPPTSAQPPPASPSWRVVHLDDESSVSWMKAVSLPNCGMREAASPTSSSPTPELVLVLDLDHTLLQTVKEELVDPAWRPVLTSALEQQQQQGGGDTQQASTPRALFHSPALRMWTKLRPGVHTFLRQVQQVFTLRLWTNGNLRYAQEMASILDPSGCLFQRRITCREGPEDAGTPNSQSTTAQCMVKSLAGVQGAAERCTLIVDDSLGVWPHHIANLIQAEKYHFFPLKPKVAGARPAQCLMHHQHDESASNGVLSKILQVLMKVQSQFSLNSSDVDVNLDIRDIVLHERHRILQGVVITFSGMRAYFRKFPEREAALSNSPKFNMRSKTYSKYEQLWNLAEQMGAKCCEDVVDELTHLVVVEKNEQLEWAKQQKCVCITPLWLFKCFLRFGRVDTYNFLV